MIKNRIISTRQNPLQKNEIGFIMWSENLEGNDFTSVENPNIFIPTDDFESVIYAFRSVFPLENPWTGDNEDIFDACGNNYFSKTVCKQIIKMLQLSTKEDDSQLKLINELVNWLEEQLIFADYIVVYGNL